MNCPECGHSIQEHRPWGCVHDPGEGYALCGCSLTPKEVESAAWRAEALAGRKLFERITGLEEMRLFGDRSILVELYEAYLAARVKETP